MTRPKAILAWSSGKDSAWALHTLRRQGDVDVSGLLTTVNRDARRVSMHAVREELLEAQAAAVGLPLIKVFIPSACSNEQYEAAMSTALQGVRADGVSIVAFGDLFLEDVRRYREKHLASSGIRPLFPLWKLDTGELARDMVRSGLRARVTCVDPRQVSSTLVGRIYDRAFLSDLPDTVDPCGERGEFHTFVHDGPMFSECIPVETGEVVEREGFFFSDLVLGENERATT